MAETSGQQSTHISSSVGEKGGCCAELDTQQPTLESPGSPFEVITKSIDFEFKDFAGEGRVSMEGHSDIPFTQESFDHPSVPPLHSGFTHPGTFVSVNQEELSLNLDPVHSFTRDSDQNVLSRNNFAPADFSFSCSYPELSGDKATPAALPQDTTKDNMEEDGNLKPGIGSWRVYHEESTAQQREERPFDANTEIRWPDADDEIDSSGESDDTVIDAGWRFKSSAVERANQSENGWAELNETQNNKKSVVISETEGDDTPEYENPDARTLCPEENLKIQASCLARAALHSPGSPQSEGFVDLGESGNIQQYVVTGHLEAEFLEDRRQENLTIEALKALADAGHEWDSESRESSPEILCASLHSGCLEGAQSYGLTNRGGSLEGAVSADKTQHIKVRDLLSWQDVKKSGAVFGVTMVLLLSLAAFSIISVLSYIILSVLTVTISFRMYKSVMQAVQKSEDGHPFKDLLEKDITLSSEKLQQKVNSSLAHVNRALKQLVRLFLVEDLVDSLKLALLMWLMTYVGAVFNGITLLILGVLIAFTAPIVYEKYKVQIDHYVSLIQEQVKSITEKIQAKLPGALKKKSE
ncbi:reticulon-3 [Bombina bombina]|uniref:reticulon-3 n=1 Tax=Bombina bombina TaxID=8345 RepID=UPI00235A8FB3|nr:reticulon-3 [Bombina bombina]XP_053575922.1 reticulon-3 [Bombina bombina]